MSPDTEIPPPSNPAESSMGETRQRILSAAAGVFADKGYARATTRTIAAEAGVNEVTLFRHFGSKQKLFAAVIEQFGGPAIVDEIETRLSGEYRADLLLIGDLIMQIMLERGESIRLMLCESTHFPELRQVMVQNPRQLRQMLARYLEMQMGRGLVRKVHPEAMAQAFWGMFFAYAVSQVVLQETVQPKISSQEVVAQFVDVFVDGTLVS